MKVLVADNLFTHRKTIALALSKINCEAIEATSTDEAMSILENAHIDILIIHLSLPDYGGLEFLKRLKGLLDEKRVHRLLTMAWNDEDSKKIAINVGVEEIIVYPLKEQEIIEKVNNLLSIIANHA